MNLFCLHEAFFVVSMAEFELKPEVNFFPKNDYQNQVGIFILQSNLFCKSMTFCGFFVLML